MKFSIFTFTVVVAMFAPIFVQAESTSDLAICDFAGIAQRQSQTIEQSLERTRRGWEERLTEQRNQLAALESRLINDGEDLTRDQLVEILQEILSVRARLEQLRRDSNEELRVRRQTEMERVYRGIREAAERIRTREGLLLIVDKGAVLSAEGIRDLTSAIETEYQRRR